MNAGADPAAGSACCAAGPDACVFTKALLAQKARCALVRRQSVGEREQLVCTGPVARINCATMAALMRERSSFALRLPRSAAPIEHAKALRLQCGGLAGLQQALGSAQPEVHQMLMQAHERWGSLLDAPWAEIVAAIVAWQPRARRAPPR